MGARGRFLYQGVWFIGPGRLDLFDRYAMLTGGIESVYANSPLKLVINGVALVTGFVTSGPWTPKQSDVTTTWTVQQNAVTTTWTPE